MASTFYNVKTFYISQEYTEKHFTDAVCAEQSIKYLKS